MDDECLYRGGLEVVVVAGGAGGVDRGGFGHGDCGELEGAGLEGVGFAAGLIWGGFCDEEWGGGWSGNGRGGDDGGGDE